MKVHLVCKSGGSYDYRHVARLMGQIKRHMPDADVVTLTDLPQYQIPNKIPLLYNFPGWWSKLELCRSDIIGDVFYLDLDSVVLGDLSPMANVRRTTMLSDFYRPEHLQSSVMLLTQNDRRRLWQAFMGAPYAIMDRFKKLRAGFNGDQNFIEEVLGAYNVQRYQQVLPGAAVSYKVDLQGGAVEPFSDARLLVFHGKPRPWDTKYG